jgi:anaerobic ribonucleoside-triphosphate reductase activating protein
VPELAWTIDQAEGVLLVRGLDRAGGLPSGDLEALLGPGRALACAAPPALRHLPAASTAEAAAGPCVRIGGYYDDSLIEGPGRRSTVKLQGCPLHCVSCITPESWDPAGGYLVPVDRLADALLDTDRERDGVTVLGGEPFAQPDGLRELVRALRGRGCRHVLVYSGYTYERLRRMAVRRPAIGAVLDDVDVLIDGPFVAALADDAGPWTGSRNQKVIDLVATRRTGRVVLLEAPR